MFDQSALWYDLHLRFTERLAPFERMCVMLMLDDRHTALDERRGEMVILA